jgi:hypothetical protein
MLSLPGSRRGGYQDITGYHRTASMAGLAVHALNDPDSMIALVKAPFDFGIEM